MPLALTIIGAFLGAWLGLFFADRESQKQFRENRDDILKALHNSLVKNSEYINQIETLHFPKGEMPTFPLDTVALAHISLNARQYLPRGSNWAERYNKLRFELDHINRKILLYCVDPSPNDLEGIEQLLTAAKNFLEDEINTLEKFVK